MTANLSHLNINVDDVFAMADFFVKNFGFTKGNLTKLDQPWDSTLTGLPDASVEFISVFSKVPEVRIDILKYFHPAPRLGSAHDGVPNLLGYRHIGFNVSDMDSMVENLTAQGYEFLSAPQTIAEMHIKTVYFRGPENILLELTQKLD